MDKTQLKEAVAYLQPHTEYEGDGQELIRENAAVQRVGGTSVASLEQSYQQAGYNGDMLREFVCQVLPVYIYLEDLSADDEWTTQLTINSVAWGKFGEHANYPHFILGKIPSDSRYTPTSLLLQNSHWAKTADVRTNGFKRFAAQNKNEDLPGYVLQKFFKDGRSMSRYGNKKFYMSSYLYSPEAYKPEALNIFEFERGLVPDWAMEKYNALQHMADLAILFGVSDKYQELLEKRHEQATEAYA